MKTVAAFMTTLVVLTLTPIAAACNAPCLYDATADLALDSYDEVGTLSEQSYNASTRFALGASTATFDAAECAYGLSVGCALGASGPIQGNTIVFKDDFARSAVGAKDNLTAAAVAYKDRVLC